MHCLRKRSRYKYPRHHHHGRFNRRVGCVEAHLCRSAGRFAGSGVRRHAHSLPPVVVVQPALRTDRISPMSPQLRRDPAGRGSDPNALDLHRCAPQRWRSYSPAGRRRCRNGKNTHPASPHLSQGRTSKPTSSADQTGSGSTCITGIHYPRRQPVILGGWSRRRTRSRRTVGGHSVALGEKAGRFRRAGDLSAGERCGAGVGMDLQHRSDLPLAGLDQTVEQVAVADNSLPHRVPTMFRDLITRSYQHSSAPT
jgi:hypothetical protein